MWLAITYDRLQSAVGRVSRGQGLSVSQVGKVQLMALVDICPVGPRKDYQLQVSSKVGSKERFSVEWARSQVRRPRPQVPRLRPRAREACLVACRALTRLARGP